ncbi:MAG: hypothetical protein DRH04_02355 [Deltaproteobacteria bacterium]|nr:MAG: hypothetical protein DRH04_02355 [Deltaproteobacteria bacterium]
MTNLTPPIPPRNLLAVDVGLRTGLAYYDQDGRLQWYRSRHFGSPAHLRRGIAAIFNDLPELSWLILEGGGTLAEIWKREAKRRRLACQWVSAEQWRRQLLLPREQRHGSDAKSHADHLARRVIDWSGAPRPTSLRHDAAEAILIGLWGAVQTGLLPNIPAVIRH